LRENEYVVNILPLRNISFKYSQEFPESQNHSNVFYIFPLGSTNSPFCFAKNGSKTLTFLSGDVQFKNFEIDFHEKQIFDQME
jgi:hypothetical protein